ncbi:Sucrose-6-phosphate hydrolase [compost metagenome]
MALTPSREALTLRIFLDRSSIEVFAADGSFSLSSRIYPQPDSLGLALFGSGEGRVAVRQAWQLSSGWL